MQHLFPSITFKDQTGQEEPSAELTPLLKETVGCELCPALLPRACAEYLWAKTLLSCVKFNHIYTSNTILRSIQTNQLLSTPSQGGGTPELVGLVAI